MALLVTGDELRSAVEDETFIEGGDLSSAEGVKYDFRLGPRILKAEYGVPIDYRELGEKDRASVVVSPGEVVFVLTMERLKLPGDMIAQLSSKRKLSHAGIVTLGGFCIDPGYEGRLLIGMLNLSSTPFPLIPGKKLIAATFLRLEGEEKGDFPAAEEPFDDFPDDLVRLIKDYSPISLKSMAESLAGVTNQLAALKEEIRSHEGWYNRFKESLDRHDRQIEKMLEGLEKETSERKVGQEQLGAGIQLIERTLSKLDGMAKVVVALLGIALTVGTGLIIAVLVKN